MRTVKIEEQTPPSDWCKEAEVVTAKLLAARSPSKRKQIISENEKLWRDPRILEWLREIFHHKCWYSEASDCVSHDTVDHFRPKGRVKQQRGAKEEEGYWWLAFNWRNYRMCGSLLNSKKNDFFPIGDGNRAKPGDDRSLELEEQTLLDPITDDASLLSFDADEDACIAIPVADCSQEEVKRVEATIEILGLNKRDKLNSKRLNTWKVASDEIANFEGANRSTKVRALAALQKHKAKEHLRKLMRYEAEFSSVTIACIEKKAPESLRKLVFQP